MKSKALRLRLTRYADPHRGILTRGSDPRIITHHVTLRLAYAHLGGADGPRSLRVGPVLGPGALRLGEPGWRREARLRHDGGHRDNVRYQVGSGHPLRRPLALREERFGRAPVLR